MKIGLPQLFLFIIIIVVIAVVITVKNNKKNNTSKKIDSQTSNVNIEDLAKLKQLLDKGIISQEEFDNKKKQMLGH